MITEDKKYISGILKNIGFSFLAPGGAMVFNYLLFENKFNLINILLCLVLALVSYIIFYMGYNYVREKD